VRELSNKTPSHELSLPQTSDLGLQMYVYGLLRMWIEC